MQFELITDRAFTRQTDTHRDGNTARHTDRLNRHGQESETQAGMQVENRHTDRQDRHGQKRETHASWQVENTQIDKQRRFKENNEKYRSYTELIIMTSQREREGD